MVCFLKVLTTMSDRTKECNTGIIAAQPEKTVDTISPESAAEILAWLEANRPRLEGLKKALEEAALI